MRVLLFGPLRDLAGWRERVVEPPASSLGDLVARLSLEDPRLGEALKGPGVQVAVDQSIIRGDPALQVGCEVAFLPPMSGG